MIDICHALGIEKLFSDEKHIAELKQHITENVRYVIPGYGCNYYLFTVGREVEFELCKGLDDTELGIAVHACGECMIYLIYDRTVATDDTTKIFEMHSRGNETKIPVRIVCPDVLAKPTAGDFIHGQIVAFSDKKIEILQNTSEYLPSVAAICDNCVKIVGKILHISEYKFELDDIYVEYRDLIVETEIGCISMVIRKDDFSFVPEEGQIISAEAVLSFDVAVEPKIFEDEPFSGNLYKGAAFESEFGFGTGFIPNLKNAERIFEDVIEHGQLYRFSRTCSDNISVFENGECTSVENKNITEWLKTILPQKKPKCERGQIVSCDNPLYLGHNAIILTEDGKISRLINLSVNNSGFVDEIHFINPSKCEIGFDAELHAIAMLGCAMCSQRANLLYEYLSEKCFYRSEYANREIIGVKRIVDRLNKVAEHLNETNRYTFEILPSEEVLRNVDDLPHIYCGKWCIKEYQRGKLAAVIFIRLNEDGLISNILLSRDGNYLKAFEKEGSSKAVCDADIPNVRQLLENFYGKDDTLKTMRKNDTPEENDNGIYVWAEADKYANSRLKSSGYTVSDVEIEDDCIGYACTRKGKDFAVYVYAYGKQKQIELDAEYCQRLRSYPLSANRTIVILYLSVEIITDDSGNTKYQVGRFDASEEEPEAWLLEKVNGKNIILFYPREEIFNMNTRFMAAFNTQNLDLLRALCTSNVKIENFEGVCAFNDGFYSNLSYLFRKYGKMKTAYVRNNDIVFSKVPYLEGSCYFSFNVTDDTDRIYRIKESAPGECYRELIITDEVPETDTFNNYPLLASVKFLPASEISRFSVDLTFDNGEMRRFDFSVDGKKDDNADKITDYSEVTEIGWICFTDKIFNHGKIVEHINMPSGIEYRNYPERGQGVAFVNGYSISTAELYFGSYPIGNFCFSGMEDKVHISQYDYAEDGYGVGRIYNLNPASPLYLFNKNTMTAYTLPEKYQATEICLYPFCGGYSEGRVMVSLLGEIGLQYHHNMMACAGMWGWLDKDLNEVISPQYVYAMNFVEGQAIVCKGVWDIKEEDGRKLYWCENEQWGIIDAMGNEIVPCEFDELYAVEKTDRLFFVHTGGWNDGHYAIYDKEAKKVILVLDFDFDMGYMFNECFAADGDILVFVNHLPGEGTDLIYAYDLNAEKYVAYKQEYTERTYNGEKSIVVNKDGQDIIVF